MVDTCGGTGRAGVEGQASITEPDQHEDSISRSSLFMAYSDGLLDRSEARLADDLSQLFLHAVRPVRTAVNEPCIGLQERSTCANTFPRIVCCLDPAARN